MKYPNYQEYERLKRQWIADHPDATPAEYTQAMREIAAQVEGWAQ